MKKKRREVGKDVNEEEYERHFKNALSNFGGISEEEIDAIPCFHCQHFIKGNVCEAFPDGIPVEIANGHFEHNKVHPEQDNDILFEPKD